MDKELPATNKVRQLVEFVSIILHQILSMKNVYPILFLGLITFFKAQAQNVGIGITTPAYPLTVQGTNLGRGITVKNGAMEVGLFNNGTVAFVQTWSEHNLNFATGNGGAKITLNHSTGNVGINTPDPTAQLDINGTLRLRGNGAAAGRVLTADANGNASWGSSVAFAAQGGFQNNVANNTFNVILYNTELFDQGNAYTPGTAKFTAPVEGIYHFEASMRMQTGVVPDNSRFLLCVNGTPQREVEPRSTFMEVSGNIKLVAGDVVDVRYFCNDDSGAGLSISNSPLKNTFSGFLIR